MFTFLQKFIEYVACIEGLYLQRSLGQPRYWISFITKKFKSAKEVQVCQRTSSQPKKFKSSKEAQVSKRSSSQPKKFKSAEIDYNNLVV